MRIVFASTPSQEEEISGLVQYIYANVFPLYFSDEEIKEFERLNVLQPSQFEDFSTLKDAFQVMTCLQTVISILELPNFEEDYSLIFDRNAENLQKLGLFFPFQFEQFSKVKNVNKSIFSAYIKPANEMLI